MSLAASKPAPGLDGLYSKLTIAALVFFAALETAYFVLSGVPSFFNPSLDFLGNAVGRDFITTWMSGRSLFGYGPASLFDHVIYNNALRVMLGPNFPEHFWSYPPHLLLFTWPLGMMPYLAAYLLWCALGIALYSIAGAAFLRREHLLFAVAAPAVAVCVFFGQNGFYAAALLIGGFALLDRWPLLAGVLFAILTVRPQFAFLLPVMLLVSGRWAAILSAIVVTGGLAAGTYYFFGPEVWTDFVHKVAPQQIWLLQNGDGLLSLTVSSVFFAARLVGLPLDLGWNLQAVVSFVALAAVIWTYLQKRDPLLSFALLVTAIFLASPYLFNYDMVVLSFVVALMRQRGGNSLLDHILGLLVWTLPVSMMLLAVIHIPLAPIVLLAFGGRLLWRLAHEAEDRAAPAAEPSMTSEAPPPPVPESAAPEVTAPEPRVL
ncbi:MAG TPA: glycosyltransferase family 87 protein [Xanthobacteraceae bacterium]|nr:glycosyltransferase family 87 protein [Xanthobacteraceae bacterium]